jgi:hypothetical protein
VEELARYAGNLVERFAKKIRYLLGRQPLGKLPDAW